MEPAFSEYRKRRDHDRAVARGLADAIRLGSQVSENASDLRGVFPSDLPTDEDSGTAGVQVTLNVGENPIVVTVTAEDGSTQPYTVTVTRAAAGFVCAEPDLAGRTQVWSANLTVEYSTSTQIYGFSTTDSIQGEDIGGLSKTGFEFGGNDYAIEALGEDTVGHFLYLDLDDSLPAQTRLHLHVCGDTFDTADADYNTTHHQYKWTGAVLDWSGATTVKLALSETIENTAATGQPGITGTPQVGQTLTADEGTIDDADGRPATFPGDYTFQWVRVDASNNEVDISGATSSNYMPAATDIDSTLRVDVSFTDDAGTAEGPLSSDATAAVVAAAGPCPAHNDWCTLMTVGSARVGSGTNYGFDAADSLGGSLDDGTIDHGTISEEVDGIWIRDLDAGNDVVVFRLDMDRLPRGTVFDLGGEEFTAEATSENPNNSNGYRWSRSSGFAWLDGQEVTVSANLPPNVTEATVDGDSLVLTYAEDLDTGSTPATGAYAVKVAGGAGVEPSGVAVAARTVTLTLATAVTAGQTVTVTYTVPTSNPLRDESHINALGFMDRVVTNNTGVVTVPIVIASNHDMIGAGLEDLVFTLTREGATTAALAATVTIAQDEDWLGNSDLSHDVTFAAGAATTKLTLAASKFSFDPDTAGDLTATAGVAGGSKTVEIVSTAEAPITVSYEKAAYTFAEDAADTEIYALATLHEDYPRAPSRGFFVDFLTAVDTAVHTEDYVALSEQETFVFGDFEHDGTTWVARRAIGFTIVNDDLYEGSEALKVQIWFNAGLPPGMTQFAKPDGSTCVVSDECTSVEYPVTITDEEDVPALSLSVSLASIAEADDDATPNVAENASEVTVESGNGKTFAADRTVTLTFAGTAVEGTDYTVAPIDTDTGTAGHQAVLPAETASVAVTVTAVDNDIIDGARTVAVSGTLDGASTPFDTATLAILDDERSNEAPEFDDGADTEREVAENTPAGTDIGTPVAATDGDDDTLTYGLEGTDAASFEIDAASGQLRTKAALDHEAKASHEVTVTADDGYGGTASVDVTVRVTDEDEPPAAPDAPGVKAVGDNATSLRVSWTEPDNAGPEIEHYDLRYRAGSTGGWTDGPSDVAETKATIENLTQGTEYEVQVRATNAEGDGAWSASGRGTPVLETAQWGDMRLVVDNAGTQSTNGAGRLEVFYRGRYGTVCDDRFDRDFTVYGPNYGPPNNDMTDTKVVANQAADLACKKLGFTTGAMVSRNSLGMNDAHDAHEDTEIWLDDVRCAEDEADWRLNRGKDPTDPDWRSSRAGLHQCYHAGLKLDNCTREEDVHLRCVGDVEDEEPLPELTGEVEQDHEYHYGPGYPFTVRLAFSEAVERDKVRAAITIATDTNTNAGTVQDLAMLDGDRRHWEATIAPTESTDTLVSMHHPGSDATCDQSAVICTGDGRKLDGIRGETWRYSSPLTAQFRPPTPRTEHDGSPFEVRLVFSETIRDTFAVPVSPDALEVTGGTIAGIVRAADGLSATVTIAPESATKDVGFHLKERHACTLTLDGVIYGTICRQVGGSAEHPLLNTLRLTFQAEPGTATQEEATALTAAFADVPVEHDGKSAFRLRLAFSEAVFEGTEAFDKNQAVRDALTVSGGVVGNARRVDPGAFDAWWICGRTRSLALSRGGGSRASPLCSRNQGAPTARRSNSR